MYYSILSRLVIWLLGKVCYKVEGKTTQLGVLVHNLIKLIKNHNEVIDSSFNFRAL